MSGVCALEDKFSTHATGIYHFCMNFIKRVCLNFLQQNIFKDKLGIRIIFLKTSKNVFWRVFHNSIEELVCTEYFRTHLLASIVNCIAKS